MMAEAARWAASISNCKRSSHVVPSEDDCKLAEGVVDESMIGCEAAASVVAVVLSGSDGRIKWSSCSFSRNPILLRLDNTAAAVPGAAGVGGRRCCSDDDEADDAAVVVVVGLAILKLGSVESLGIGAVVRSSTIAAASAVSSS